MHAHVFAYFLPTLYQETLVITWCVQEKFFSVAWILLTEKHFTLDKFHPANFLLFPPQITWTMCLIFSMHLCTGVEKARW
jgi:hypothetical protein